MNFLHQNLEASDSEDEDYVPDMIDDEEEMRFPRQQMRPEKRAEIDQIWREMRNGLNGHVETERSEVKMKGQEEDKDSLEKLEAEALAIVRRMKEKERMEEKVVEFAGKQYKITTQDTIANKTTTIMEEPTNNSWGGRQDKKKKDITPNQYLAQVLKMISNKAKSINSVSKSKLDWGNFVSKEGIEKELERNRKDGYLEKRKFLAEASIKEGELIKSRKRQKLQPDFEYPRFNSTYTHTHTNKHIDMPTQDPSLFWCYVACERCLKRYSLFIVLSTKLIHDHSTFTFVTHEAYFADICPQKNTVAHYLTILAHIYFLSLIHI
eukprot:TRINITY_DN3681_c0_g1_i1.p1 TRINITY_DN3681_c0_g1~~TRINITY_DN3681_c0_g1_i1.p1  ORF type:complete len:322 (+),score=48.27 TRINITY_DN3681_c0_g1_i1:359-1324(+)